MNGSIGDAAGLSGATSVWERHPEKPFVSTIMSGGVKKRKKVKARGGSLRRASGGGGGPKPRPGPNPADEKRKQEKHEMDMALQRLQQEIKQNELETAKALHGGEAGNQVTQARALGDLKVKHMQLLGKMAQISPGTATEYANNHSRLLTGKDQTDVQVRVNEDGKSFGLFTQEPGKVVKGDDGVFKEQEGGYTPYRGMADIEFDKLFNYGNEAKAA